MVNSIIAKAKKNYKKRKLAFWWFVCIAVIASVFIGYLATNELGLSTGFQNLFCFSAIAFILLLIIIFFSMLVSDKAFSNFINNS